MRRPLRWAFAPAEALRLVRGDAHPVALFGAWAGGGATSSRPSRPASAAPPARWPTSSTSRSRPSPTAPSAAAGSATWAIARAARRCPGRAARAARMVVRLLRQRAGAGPGDGGVVLRGAVDGRAAPRRSSAASRTWSPARPSQPSPGGYGFSPFRLTPGADGHQEAVRPGGGVHPPGDIFQANITLRAEAEFDGDPLDAFCQAAAGAAPALRRLHRRLRSRRRAAPPRGRCAATPRAAAAVRRHPLAVSCPPAPAPGRPHGHLQADQGHRAGAATTRPRRRRSGPSSRPRPRTAQRT